MNAKVSDFESYIEQIPEERKVVFRQLQQTILDNLPEGFEQQMSYGMIGFVVPHILYPAGYHCDPKLPLPFISIASQKNFVAVYHMGMYADEKLLNWFVAEYPKHTQAKLDMGKSCIRFKKIDQIPLELIGKLVQKMTVKEWVELYESNYKRK